MGRLCRRPLWTPPVCTHRADLWNPAISTDRADLWIPRALPEASSRARLGLTPGLLQVTKWDSYEVKGRPHKCTHPIVNTPRGTQYF